MSDRNFDVDELEATLRGRFAYGTAGLRLGGRPAREGLAGLLGVERNTVDGWATGKNGVRLPAAALVAEAALHPADCTLALACELAGGLFVPLEPAKGDLGAVLHASAREKTHSADSEHALARALADGKLTLKEARDLLAEEEGQLAAQYVVVAEVKAAVKKLEAEGA